MNCRTLVIFTTFLAGCSRFEPIVDCGPMPCEKPGQRSCIDGSPAVCEQLQNECLEWVSSTVCTDGTKCGGLGYCGSDECPEEGVRQCDNDIRYRECQTDEYGFLYWSVATACPGEQFCVNGNCGLLECENPGERMCASDNSGYYTCTVTDEGMVWSQLAPCDSGQICAGKGVCGTHECEEDGLSVCSEGNPAVVRLCQVNDDGFLTLGPPVACEDGQLCGASGGCGDHECGPKGIKSCNSDGTGTRVCGVSTDKFLVWFDGDLCAEGETCKGPGICDSDECSELGLVACADSQTVAKCILDKNGFLRWSPLESCGPLAICLDDICIDHECPVENGKKCVGDGAEKTQYSVCEADEKGVLKWGPSQSCSGEGIVCKGPGVCSSDQCPTPQAFCIDGKTAQSCFETDAGFLELSEPVNCDGEKKCKAGVCGEDTCAPSDSYCNDTGLAVVCDLGENDFYSLSPPKQCPDKTECLGDGNCTVIGEQVLWSKPTEHRPHLAALSSGGFAAAWAGKTGGANMVLVRRFDAGGNPLEVEQPISGPLGETPPEPTVAPIPSFGEYAVAVAWLDAGQQVNKQMKVRVVTDVGKPAQAILNISGPTIAAPYVVPVSQSTLGIAVRTGTVKAKKTLQLALTDGSKVSNLSSALYSNDDPAVFSGFSAASVAGGGAWMTYSMEAINAFEPKLGFVRVDSKGNFLDSSDAILVPELPPLKDTNKVLAIASPSVAPGPKGDALVAYDLKIGNFGGDLSSWAVRAVYIAADGIAAKNSLAVNVVKAGDQRHTSVTYVPTYGWFVVWDSEGGADLDVKGRLMGDGNTTLASDTEVLINKQTAGPQSYPVAITLKDGRVVVAWRNGDGNNSALAYRILAQDELGKN